MCQVPWPTKVRVRLVNFDNPTGNIKNYDLEMAAEVLSWLVLEALVSTQYIHVGLYSDSLSTVIC